MQGAGEVPIQGLGTVGAGAGARASTAMIGAGTQDGMDIATVVRMMLQRDGMASGKVGWQAPSQSMQINVAEGAA